MGQNTCKPYKIWLGDIVGSGQKKSHKLMKDINKVTPYCKKKKKGKPSI